MTLRPPRQVGMPALHLTVHGHKTVTPGYIVRYYGLEKSSTSTLIDSAPSDAAEQPEGGSTDNAP
jgi:hypothetical protein